MNNKECELPIPLYDIHDLTDMTMQLSSLYPYLSIHVKALGSGRAHILNSTKFSAFLHPETSASEFPICTDTLVFPQTLYR